ncbi:MAG: amino acid permease [Gammaproteobacteria bacterium]|nr:amino acid permease [Gammaproteobacteria bacterium]
MITRQLGFWMCTALVVGNMIGMGIFVLPASLAPFGFNAFLGWGATVVGCVFLALAFAALARRMPEADGPFAYIRATLGETVAFAALWCYWISIWIANAALAVGAAGYIVSFEPRLASIPPAIIAAGLVWLFVLINLFGARTGGRVQVLTVALKLVPLALVVLLGLWMLVANPVAYTEHIPTVPISLQSTMAASTIALFAMLGLESATVPAGRVVNPEKTIPRATLVGTVLTAVVYIAVTAVSTLLVPQETLAASNAPFVDVLDRLLGIGNGRWLALFVIISGLGCLNGWTLVVAELTRTLASRQLLPPILANSNRHGAPAPALLLVGVLATGVALMNYSKTLVEGFTFLSIIVTAANLPVYLCCSLGLLWLWRRAPGNVPRHAWLFGAGGLAFSIFAFIGVGTEPFLWALALAGVGIPVYFWMRWRHPVPAAAGAAPLS